MNEQNMKDMTQDFNKDADWKEIQRRLAAAGPGARPQDEPADRVDEEDGTDGPTWKELEQWMLSKIPHISPEDVDEREVMKELAILMAEQQSGESEPEEQDPEELQPEEQVPEIMGRRNILQFFQRNGAGYKPARYAAMFFAAMLICGSVYLFLNQKKQAVVVDAQRPAGAVSPLPDQQRRYALAPPAIPAPGVLRKPVKSLALKDSLPPSLLVVQAPADSSGTIAPRVGDEDTGLDTGYAPVIVRDEAPLPPVRAIELDNFADKMLTDRKVRKNNGRNYGLKRSETPLRNPSDLPPVPALLRDPNR